MKKEMTQKYRGKCVAYISSAEKMERQNLIIKCKWNDNG